MPTFPPRVGIIRGWDSLSLPSLPTLGEVTGCLDITLKIVEYYIFGGSSSWPHTLVLLRALTLIVKAWGLGPGVFAESARFVVEIWYFFQ